MRILTTVLALTLMAPNAFAQSIVTGAISGTVVDQLGRPMVAAHVILTEVGTGTQRDGETGAGGQFDFLFVPPGTYEVFAEELGYRPQRVRGVPVGPGRSTTVSISLSPAPPPVDSVVVIEYSGGAFGSVGPSESRRFSELEIRRVPGRTREFTELGRFSSTTLGSMATQGLPGRLSGIVIDGVPYAGAIHPELAESPFGAVSFPLTQFGSAELLAHGVDVEYAGFAGATLSGRTLRGTRRLEVRGYGDWSNEGLTTSDHFEPGSVSHTTLRGGVLITGPVIPDTAHFVLGAEVRRLATPLPRAWSPNGLDSALLAVASDSFGVDLAAYMRPRVVTADLISAFGRFDGRLSEQSAVSLRANFARLEVENPEVGQQQPFIGLGANLEGTDVNGAAQFTSSLTAGIGMELRVAVEYSEREYFSDDLPATLLAGSPIALGSNPALPGRFERLAFRASETFHFRLRTHQLKIGGSAVVSSFDLAPRSRRGGGFVFGGIDDFSNSSGSFTQLVGPAPSIRFNTSEFGGFLQDRWQAAPGLELTFGFRVDGENLPVDEIPQNAAWLAQTGLSNDSLRRTITKFSPRFGLRWDVGNRHRWLVRGQAGIHYGVVDPAAFAEVVSQSGGSLERQGVGDLSRWPAAPDSGAAPVGEPRLAFPGRDFEAPRTFSASLGVAVSVAPGTELEVSGNYRHTDFLARRNDLNRSVSPSGRDQFGRPVYGQLIQHGGALGVVPGSNRRFSRFGIVSSLDADGVSDYWGLTARLEHHLARVRLFGSYTYSRTEDNLVFVGGPELQLNPDPDGLDAKDWLDGRSDFDVPHRVTIGVELDLTVFRLAGFFRHQSGFPFTPGFPPGVDANGDGSAYNDPAFVDDGIAGIADLLGRQDCLRSQVGRFAERNSCRANGTNTLDVRLALRLFERAGYRLDVVADGLNLLDSTPSRLDRALYLVDDTGTLVTDPVTGNVTVPLVANPNFGREAHSFATGRWVRLGVRLGS